MWTVTSPSDGRKGKAGKDTAWFKRGMDENEVWAGTRAVCSGNLETW